MYRYAMERLKTWKDDPKRKPLIIRGARQVGKSYLARAFGKEQFENMVEIDFERSQDLCSLFGGNDPQKTVHLLELQMNAAIKPGRTLLFLDEIQAAPSVIPALRCFLEQLPALHVIAAGSLLEFALGGMRHSMPVGRIEYLHLGPVQFEEFLLAAGEERLLGYLNEFEAGTAIAEAIHKKLLGLYRMFLLIGGMPEAVSVYLSTRSPIQSEEVKHSIVSTFKDDFAKYGRRVKHLLLSRLFARVPAMVGRKFKYVNADSGERSEVIAAALDLLCMALLAYRIRHSSANGPPLGAEANDRVFKVLFLDVGLMSTALGLNMLDYERVDDLLLVNNGAVCEQAVGQHLLYSLPSYQEPGLHYWVREKQNSMAEVDYLIAEGNTIVPVEVKAGKTGTLKSLHMFLREKRRSLGVRLNSDPPSLLDAKTSLPAGKDVPFQLLSLPLYMAGHVRRLVRRQLRR